MYSSYKRIFNCHCRPQGCYTLRSKVMHCNVKGATLSFLQSPGTQLQLLQEAAALYLCICICLIQAHYCHSDWYRSSYAAPPSLQQFPHFTPSREQFLSTQSEKVSHVHKYLGYSYLRSIKLNGHIVIIFFHQFLRLPDTRHPKDC